MKNVSEHSQYKIPLNGSLKNLYLNKNELISLEIQNLQVIR